MASAAAAQINPRLPPLPPPEEPVAQPAPKLLDIFPLPLTSPPPPLPEVVVIPAGTRIAVVLDSPLSTRITKTGDSVSFRTSEPLPVDDFLEIPPETQITGKVVEARRPGGFGKQGVMRVKVEQIKLSSGTSTLLVARLDSQDVDNQGRISADSNRGADLYTLATWAAQGTLLGASVKGGKGAAVGAGAGAVIGLIILMARRGPDLYLEPGMPFAIVLDQQVELPGTEVYAAQQAYNRTHAAELARSANSTSAISRDPDNATLDSARPKLKRRPKKP
jgi:hypothetical protein